MRPDQLGALLFASFRLACCFPVFLAFPDTNPLPQTCFASCSVAVSINVALSSGHLPVETKARFREVLPVHFSRRVNLCFCCHPTSDLFPRFLTQQAQTNQFHSRIRFIAAPLFYQLSEDFSHRTNASHQDLPPSSFYACSSEELSPLELIYKMILCLQKTDTHVSISRKRASDESPKRRSSAFPLFLSFLLS